MTDLEQIRLKHRQRFLEKLPVFIGRMAWPREQIEAFQTERLRETLRFARDNSPWHRRRLADIDIDVFTPRMIADIPLMTKSDLMSNWEDIVAVPSATKRELKTYFETPDNGGYFRGEYKAISSGGTSGNLGYYLYDWEAWSDHWAGINRSYIQYVEGKSDDPSRMRFATISADCSIHISYALFETFSNPLSATRHIPISLPIETIVSQLNEFSPEYLHLYPSILPILIHKTKTGALDINPHVILSTSEALKSEVREQAQETWDALVLDTWSASEGSGSFACLSGKGFHVSEDLNIIEPLDVKDGWSTGVAITNLYNRALPLVRYYIDDEFQFSDKPCECGVRFKRVEGVRGRVDEYLDYGDDVLVHPFAIESALSIYDQLLSFQVLQVENGVQVRVVTKDSVPLPDANRRIEDALVASGCAAPSVSIEYADALERSRGGKLKKIVRTGLAAG